MKHDHENQLLLLDGPPVANNPGAKVLDDPAPPRAKKPRRLCDLLGQSFFWNALDKAIGIRVTALACHWSITEEALIAALRSAARMAAAKFRHSIPFDMTIEDFQQEIICRTYKEAIRWRDMGKKGFAAYVRSTAFNRARDILRADQLKNSCAVSELDIAEEALRRELDPDTLTTRQRKQIVNGLRGHLVEYHPVFHTEPTYEIEDNEDDDDEGF